MPLKPKHVAWEQNQVCNAVKWLSSLHDQTKSLVQAQNFQEILRADVCETVQQKTNPFEQKEDFKHIYEVVKKINL